MKTNLGGPWEFADMKYTQVTHSPAEFTGSGGRSLAWKVPDDMPAPGPLLTCIHQGSSPIPVVISQLCDLELVTGSL